MADQWPPQARSQRGGDPVRADERKDRRGKVPDVRCAARGGDAMGKGRFATTRDLFAINRYSPFVALPSVFLSPSDSLSNPLPPPFPGLNPTLAFIPPPQPQNHNHP